MKAIDPANSHFMVSSPQNSIPDSTTVNWSEVGAVLKFLLNYFFFIPTEER